jgi:heme-degrading monooxygenase HmoA
MTHHRIWRFRPPPEREQEFASAYGSGGPWAELFAKAKGYCGTTLLRPAEPGGWWLTIDRWNSLAEFNAFGGDFGDEYRALDAKLEGVAGEEEFVGAFEE